MWLFYLALCEIGFRHRTMMVFQLQLAKRLDSLPLTRDYMHEWESAHTGEAKSRSAELESVR
jgi:cyclopropane-fatty-acyl-phospholipid synthase